MLKNEWLLLFALLLLAGCEHAPLNGRYYTQNNMLEVAPLSHERFAFQIIATASRQTKYISGKAIHVSSSQYFYEGEKQNLLFEFEDNYVRVTQIDNDKSSSYKHFEGTYLFINPAKLHEPTENIMRVSHHQ
ncbi:hypothetical protein [Thermoflexibacter ruber]|uniref:Uncharacterized protein n=1 Tax=Thermoflexibacter ruber TaxID=1003 RepID=A0A1I2IF68_9BACT|nr:hypothetical protein [Thermoflexibacter ruber]SFF40293.1 hypothetical protein SAMN04488541_103130 [Thermoflexibacter ruber]